MWVKDSAQSVELAIMMLVGPRTEGGVIPNSRSTVRIVEADGDVVELVATTANGDITVITSMTKAGDTLILKGMHIDGPGPGSVGLRELRSLASELGKQQGAKQVTIFGGTRTTGANPGKVSRPITFPVGD
jgi:hypothetical protein